MTLQKWVSFLLPHRFKKRRVSPPELPHHPPRGLTINEGDTLQITKVSIELKDLSESTTSAAGPITFRVPEWAGEFEAGATFRLKRLLPAARYTVDGNVFEIDADGRSIHVALKTASSTPFVDAYRLAEKVLDLLAVEAYRVSLLNDPLREYSVWSRAKGMTTLRCVTTSRLSASTHSEAVVRDATGAVRPPTKRPPQRWHASHAYFRRSQATDNLDDSYRYLYLALESLISEVYPWNRDTSENAWLRAGLRHIAEGYKLDLNEFLERPARDPYRQFMKEQYKAQRCALFHAKVSESPIHPSDIRDKEDLAAATRRLGRLYVRLAGLTTGAGFAGGGMSYHAFSQMMTPISQSTMYVSAFPDFSAEAIIHGTTRFEREHRGIQAVHHLVGRWDSQALPPTLVRWGSFMSTDGDVNDAIYNLCNIETQGLNVLECVVQLELANAASLREWFL